MHHRATARFWECYNALAPEIREQADRAFELLKSNPAHPSIRLKQTGRYFSARIGLHYRALAEPDENGFVWVWIGSHADYDGILRR